VLTHTDEAELRALHAIRVHRDLWPPAEPVLDSGVIPVAGTGIGDDRGIDRQRAEALVDLGDAEAMDLDAWMTFWADRIADALEEALDLGIAQAELREALAKIPAGLLMVTSFEHPRLMRRVAEHAEHDRMLEGVELCNAIERSTRRMRYVAYLGSDEWKKKRRDALERAGSRCQLCNRPGELQTHHRTYERVPRRERASDLTVLCVDCHSWFHKQRGMPDSGGAR
jgi:5-methylcytosine-specific restriction endonuclease McrA